MQPPAGGCLVHVLRRALPEELLRHRLATGQRPYGRRLVLQHRLPARLQIGGESAIVTGTGHLLDAALGHVCHPGIAIPALLDHHLAHGLQQAFLVVLAQQAAVAGTEHLERAYRAVDLRGHAVEGVAHHRQLDHVSAFRQAHATLTLGQPAGRQRQAACRPQNQAVHDQPGDYRQRHQRGNDGEQLITRKRHQLGLQRIRWQAQQQVGRIGRRQAAERHIGVAPLDLVRTQHGEAAPIRMFLDIGIQDRTGGKKRPAAGTGREMRQYLQVVVDHGHGGARRQDIPVDQFGQPIGADGGKHHRLQPAIAVTHRIAEIDARHPGDPPDLIDARHEAVAVDGIPEVGAIAQVQAALERQRRTHHAAVDTDDAEIGIAGARRQQAFEHAVTVRRVFGQLRHLSQCRQQPAGIGHQLAVAARHHFGHRPGMGGSVLGRCRLQVPVGPQQQRHHRHRHQQHTGHRNGAQIQTRALARHCAVPPGSGIQTAFAGPSHGDRSQGANIAKRALPCRERHRRVARRYGHGLE